MTPSATFPPPPNSETYYLTELNQVPRISVSTVPVNPLQGFRPWQLPSPIPAGKTTSSLYNYGYFTATGDYGSASITYGEAMAPPNVAAADLDKASSDALEAGPYGLLARPIPARPSLDSETIFPTPFGLMVRNSAYVAPSDPATATTDAKKLAAIRAILA